MPIPHGMRQLGSPGRVPYVYADSAHPTGIARTWTPGLPGEGIEGDSTSLRIQSGNGTDYRQGQWLNPGETHMTFTVRISAGEWNNQRAMDDYRTYKVTVNVGDKASAIAKLIEDMSRVVADRNYGARGR